MSMGIPQPVEGHEGPDRRGRQQRSIAYGCARAFHELGAELAITYVNDRTKAYVEPARELKAPIFMPLDVSRPDELEAVFARITKEWGRLDSAPFLF